MIKKFTQVAVLDLAANQRRQISLAGLPTGNQYLAAIWLRFKVSVKQGGNPVSADQIKAAIGKISLWTGSHPWVYALTVNELLHVGTRTGTFIKDFDTVNPGYTAYFWVPIPFQFNSLVEPYDTMPHVKQLEGNSYFEVESGVFGDIESINMIAFFQTFNRQHLYIAPQISYRKQTITVESAGDVKFTNSSLFTSLIFRENIPADTVLGSISLNGETLLNNVPLIGLTDIFDIHHQAVSDPFWNRSIVIDYRYRKNSLADLIVKEGSILSYKDFVDSLVPFDVLTVDVIPVRAAAGSPVVASTVSPLVI